MFSPSNAQMSMQGYTDHKNQSNMILAKKINKALIADSKEMENRCKESEQNSREYRYTTKQNQKNNV